MNPRQKLDRFFEKMWLDFCDFSPQAKRVYNLLGEADEIVINDHVAFRTFSHSKINALTLAKHFESYGYVLAHEYKFSEKNLSAFHFEHFDVDMPKVFISEFDLNRASDFIKKTVNTIADDITDESLAREQVIYSGRPWKASYKIYMQIKSESEYAAWVYAHGFRPNHFTIFVNHLKKLNDISKLNNFLTQNGFHLNTSGGAVKGSPQDYLEQSSTIADKVLVSFNEGSYSIPGCYYEFAKRYSLPNGKLFQGFVANSADKIFESTYV